MALTHVHVNNAKLCARMNEFRIEEKYADLTVHCENRSFKCHRFVLASASDVFDAMFGGNGGNYQETNAKNITVGGISADVFEEVLQYVYTGNARVTISNVYDLLNASELYKLDGLDDLCVNFVKSNQLSVEDTLDILQFAHVTGRSALSEPLTAQIAQRFKRFSQANKFFDICFNDFSTILRQQSSTSEEWLFNVIVRWVNHRRKERLRHCQDLVRTIRFENVSSAFTRFMFSEVFTLSNSTALTRLNMKPVTLDRSADAPSTMVHYPIPQPYLHFYVKYPDENLIRIFSLSGPHSSLVCNPAGEIRLTNSKRSIRTVAAANSHLYSMEYNVLATSGSNSTIFRVSDSVTMRSALDLQPPPLILDNFSLCSIESYVYAYRKNLFDPIDRMGPPNSILFNEEEIGRGIYAYNSEVNCWFPVPAMKERMKHCALVACDNNLYLIGGVSEHPSCYNGRYLQAYDHRTGAWRELPKTPITCNQFINAGSCTLSDKIFVNGTKYLESFDPKANKWKAILPNQAEDDLMSCYRSVLYSARSDRDNHLVITYNDLVQKTERVISELLADTAPPGRRSISDCVLYKLYSG